MGNDLRPCNESSSDKHTEMVSTLSNPPLIKQDHASAAPRTLPNHPTAHPLHSGQMREEQAGRSALTLSACLKLSQIIVVSDENKGEIDCSVLPTPYEVIKLATTAGLEQVIRKHGREMMRKFEDGGSHWHLNSRGYYVNILAPNFLAVFTDRLYFEGSVVKSKEGNYLPHQNGIILTEEGVYKGAFKEGVAEGRGRYTTEEGVIFEGEWRDGQMVSGTIESSKFRFKGELKNGLVEGKGQLRFKNGEAEYQGSFREGLFEGENCFYKCQEYSYKGDFRAGKKEGYGVICEAESYGQGKANRQKRTYRPPSKLYGVWRNDSLISELPLPTP